MKKLPAAPIICIWIFLSSSVILMNAWILYVPVVVVVVVVHRLRGAVLFLRERS